MFPAASLGLLLLTCTLVLADTGQMFGEVMSPGYPFSYPNNSRAEWSISVPLGYRIQIQFHYFQIEPSQGCVYDRLEITAEGASLGVFCGNENSVMGNPPMGRMLISPGNTVTLQFQSDFSNEGQYLGFKLYYQAVDIDECEVPEGSAPFCQHLCHNTLGSYVCSCRRGYQMRENGKDCEVQCQETFIQMNGVLQTPEYPDPYPANLKCNYSIQIEPGFAITLKFQGLFDIEDHREVKCPYDQLMIEYGDTVLGPLCGRKISLEPIKTRRNRVDILFHTDGTGNNHGWELHYSTDRIQCPNLPLLSHGTISPTQPIYRFMDRVSFSCNIGYKIIKGDMELKSFKVQCTKSGRWNKDVLATCELIDCGEPKHLENGNFTVLERAGVENGYQTRIQYSCHPRYTMETQGDAIYTCSASRRWVNPSVRETIPFCAPDCGLPDHPVTRQVGRILGGSEAPPASFPWQVYLAAPWGGRGAGVLVHPRWVLTAAHVLWVPRNAQRPPDAILESFGVYLGDNNLEDLMASPARPVESVHLHPGYRGDLGDFAHDLALISLAEPVRLTRHMIPACLPPPVEDRGCRGVRSGPVRLHCEAPDLYRRGLLGYVAGWGVTNDQRLLSELQYVGLPMAARDRCVSAMRQAQGGGKGQPLEVTEGMFCAGTGLGEADACQGDSGGAFAVNAGPQQRWYVTGVVSWGLGCGMNGTYGIYTRVDKYMDWILGVMEAADG